VPLPPDELFQRVIDASGDDGRLAPSRMTGWEIFPFERDGLRVVALEPPHLPEPPRRGEGTSPCGVCDGLEGVVWSDEHWQLAAPAEPSGIPLVLLLFPRAHVDLGGLDDERASELGRLVVHLARAIEALPHVARAHVSRWGDGGAHLHVFFLARPAGFSQLRGSCLPIWDDLLPPTPVEVRDRDAALVAERLAAAYGGTAGAR